MNNIIIDHFCSSCGQSFKSLESIEFHKNVCIYYQYKQMYNTDIDAISTGIIMSIVTIYNLLELYKLDDNDILTSHILNKLQSKLHTNELYIYIYNRISTINNINYISYNELISIISNVLNISTNIFCNVINTYDKCCEYFK